MTDPRDRPLGATPLPGGRCRFLVFAPSARAVEVRLLSPAERVVGLERDASGYHHAVVDGVNAGALFLYRLDDGIERPDPASRLQPQGVHGPSMVTDPEDVRLVGPWMARDPALFVHPLRAARRDVHARRHLRRRHPAPGLPRGAGDHRRGADARGAVPREEKLGIRRRLPVRGAGELRRAGRAEAPGRRLPPARPGRRPGRGLQPSRAGGQLPLRLRPLLHRPVPHPVGIRRELRRPRQRRGPAVFPGERPLLAAGVPRRRAAPRRDPRHHGLQRLPFPLRARRGREGPPEGREPDGLPDSGERPERRADRHAPGGRGVRPRRAMERRLPPRAPHAPDGGTGRVLRRLRRHRAHGARVHRRLRLLRAILRSTASAGTETRRATSRRGSSSCSPRTTTRWGTGCAGSGSPAWSASSP